MRPEEAPAAMMAGRLSLSLEFRIFEVIRPEKIWHLWQIDQGKDSSGEKSEVPFSIVVLNHTE